MKSATGDLQVQSFKGYALIVDRDTKKLAGAWVKVWSLALEALAERMIPYIPNDEEHADFAEGVNADVRNMNYQLYCNHC